MSNVRLYYFSGAVGVAAAFARMTSAPVRRYPRYCVGARSVWAVTMSLLLFVASIVSSLPSWFQRVPNGFWIEAQSGSGFDNVGISRALWASKNLYTGARFAGDITATVLLSTLAPLDPVKDPGAIYYSDRLTPEDVAHIKSSGIIYVDVDMRLSECTPLGGKFFPADIYDGQRTIDPKYIAKFDTIAGVSRIYDSGYARFYECEAGGMRPMRDNMMTRYRLTQLDYWRLPCLAVTFSHLRRAYQLCWQVFAVQCCVTCWWVSCGRPQFCGQG